MNGTLEVLYLDSDTASGQAVQSVIEDHEEDVEVSVVGTVAAARDVATAVQLSCLVLDPVGLEGDVESLLSATESPVILYTSRDPETLDDALLDRATTVVNKNERSDQRSFLAEKTISIANAPVDRSEYALSAALSDIESRADDDEIAVLIDDEGTVVWSTAPVAEFVLGDDASPVESENFYELLARGVPDSPAGEEQLEAIWTQPSTAMTVRVTAGSKDRHLLRRGYQLPDEAGGLQLVLLKDVTETARRDARMALLELLVDRAQDGLYTLNEQGIIDFCNESFATNLGYEPAEIRGEHASKVLAPGELTKGQQTIEELLTSPDKKSTTVTLTFVQRDGTEREMSIHYTLIRGDAGTYRGLMGVVRDITERREREREIRETTERLNLAVEGAELGVWDWNPQTNAVRFNERWAGMLGYERAEIDQTFEARHRRVHPDDLERIEELLDEVRNGERDNYSYDFRMHTKSGGWKWIRDTGRVFERNENGEAVRAVGIHQDITDQRQRQQALERQRDELATLDQVHVLIQDLIRALSEAATREEIEETVCTRIVESELYQFAWLGERTGGTTQLDPKISAGDDDGYLDEILGTTGDAALSHSPGENALRTASVQTVQNLGSTTETDSWRTAACERGFRSVAAVPLKHGDVVHGVLCVYADRPGAFSNRAIESFTVLGEMIGFSFAAIQNRQLLTHGKVLELRFESTSSDSTLISIASEHGCRFESVGHVDIGSEKLQYFAIDGAEPAAVMEGFDRVAEVVDARVVREEDDGGLLELQSTESFHSLLLNVGARPRDVIVDESRISITIEAPTDADSRTIRERLSTHVPGLSLASKQERERHPEELNTDADPREYLTDRQREVIRTAYLAGYFAWPRDTTAEQLAETLDISSPTLHQHLRRAERNLIDGLFDVQ